MDFNAHVIVLFKLMLYKKKYFSHTPQQIIFCASIVLFVIIYGFVEYQLKHTKDYLYARFSEKISAVEETFNNKIADSKHIIYGLATTISEKYTVLNHSDLIELIQNFDPRYNYDDELSIPLVGITFINADKTEIIHTQQKNKDYLDVKQCLEEKEKEFFKVKISPIRIENGIKEHIIPMNISIVDKSNNYLGTICSGLILRELTEKLNTHFDRRNLDSIKIKNKTPHNENISIKFLDFKELLQASFFDKLIPFSYALKKYPFLLGVNLRHTFLKNAIYTFVLFSFSVLTLFIITTYLLFKNIKKYYEEPLHSIQKKIYQIFPVVNLNDENQPYEFEENKFSPNKLAFFLNQIIDICYPILLEQSELTTEKNKIQKNILNLFFIEQHYMSLQKHQISEDKLYINQLYCLVKEDEITMQLDKFLEHFITYCSEFYHEFSIKLIIEEQDKKFFSFKQAALIEAMFSIFTFILRSNLEAKNNIAIIKAEFIDDDSPTITIEFNIEESLYPLGWEAGPYFVNTSLLAIYLLAKENNFIFNIHKDKDRILFVLEPINKKLEFYNLTSS